MTHRLLVLSCLCTVNEQTELLLTDLFRNCKLHCIGLHCQVISRNIVLFCSLAVLDPSVGHTMDEPDLQCPSEQARQTFLPKRSFHSSVHTRTHKHTHTHTLTDCSSWTTRLVVVLGCALTVCRFNERLPGREVKQNSHMYSVEPLCVKPTQHTHQLTCHQLTIYVHQLLYITAFAFSAFSIRPLNID